MKKVNQVITVVISVNLLTGCLASFAGMAYTTVASNAGSVMLSKKSAPKKIEISQQGRIITAEFGFNSYGGLGAITKGSQVRGFQEWATAAIVREAPKRGCINVSPVFSANSGTSVNLSKIQNNLRYKCLEKDTVMSEHDTLEDKQVVYAEQIKYIEQNPEMIVYK